MPRAQQLGRYLLLDRLAFGGMAEIYRAKTFDSEGRSHLVAVKRVLPHLTTDDDFLKMLVDEAKLTARMKHENIAAVYEISQAGDEYFIAMEFVDGKDVRSLLERHRRDKKPIPPEHVAWIAAEVAAGLNTAHALKDEHGDPLSIVHRDISPSNILCAYSGEVKLCDFGIAKATSSRVQTRTGVIKGKVKYMSPEQAMGRKLDGRSDLFSLGSVMYEMLTLHPPFTAKSEVDLIFAVRDAKKKPMRDFVPSVPDELAKIVDKLMTRARSDRYPNGAEVRDALWKFLDIYKPGYRRTQLGRYMRHLFAPEIDKELRQLEGYELDIGDGQVHDLGVNLIADALGKNAQYSKFTPMPKLQQPASTSVHDLDTRIFDTRNLPTGKPAPPTEKPAPPTEKVPPVRRPSGFDGMPARKPIVPERKPPPPKLPALTPDVVSQGRAKLTPRAMKAAEDNEPPTDPQPFGGSVHDLETRILDTSKLGARSKPDPFDQVPDADIEADLPDNVHDLPTRILKAPTGPPTIPNPRRR